MPTKKIEKCLELKCNALQYSRGYCNNHYQKYKKTDKILSKKQELAVVRINDETLRNSHRFDNCWLDHEDFLL